MAKGIGKDAWREVISVALRSGILPPERATDVFKRIDESPDEGLSVETVATWTGLPAATVESCRALSNVTPPSDAQPTLRIDKGALPPPIPTTPTQAAPVPARATSSGVPSRLGPYLLDLDAPLGHGGYGMVFRARHERLGTACAVKVLMRPEGEKAVERFRREAALVSGMGKHLNVVSVFDRPEVVQNPAASEVVVGRGRSVLGRSVQRFPASRAVWIG